MSTNAALVLRATGAQGVGVTKHLLQAGWTVHALVRDPEHDRAIALKELGATLHKGDLNDPESIEAAAKGCNALFLNQMPSQTEGAEAQEARDILSAVVRAGIKQVVHSTTLPLNDPHVEEKLKGSTVGFAILGKGQVEQVVRSSALTWTIIRPGLFMTNFTAPIVGYMFPELAQGKFVNSYGPDAVLPLVDTDDIGAFAVAAFQDPPRFKGKVINVVSEFQKVAYIINEIEKASGKRMEVIYRTDAETAELEPTNPLVAGQRTTVGLEKFVKMEDVKAWNIPLTDFGTFLEKHRDALVP